MRGTANNNSKVLSNYCKRVSTLINRDTQLRRPTLMFLFSRHMMFTE